MYLDQVKKYVENLKDNSEVPENVQRLFSQARTRWDFLVIYFILFACKLNNFKTSFELKLNLLKGFTITFDIKQTTSSYTDMLDGIVFISVNPLDYIGSQLIAKEDINIEEARKKYIKIIKSTFYEVMPHELRHVVEAKQNKELYGNNGYFLPDDIIGKNGVLFQAKGMIPNGDYELQRIFNILYSTQPNELDAELSSTRRGYKTTDKSLTFIEYFLTKVLRGSDSGNNMDEIMKSIKDKKDLFLLFIICWIFKVYLPNTSLKTQIQNDKIYTDFVEKYAKVNYNYLDSTMKKIREGIQNLNHLPQTTSGLLKKLQKLTIKDKEIQQLSQKQCILTSLYNPSSADEFLKISKELMQNNTKKSA